MEAPDKRIWLFFKYSRDAFRDVGIDLKFPKNTNPEKTYMWRYLSYFLGKVEEWDISNSTTQKLIFAIVKYSKKHNQLKRGLAILTSDKLLEVGHKAIRNEIKTKGDILLRLRIDYATLSKYDDIVGTLLDKPSNEALPNIIQWYIQGKLSQLYLSVSKSCSSAMGKLSDFELSMLPSDKELLLLRHIHFNSVLMKHRAKLILGEEWKNGF